jgi:hypothetical protein
MSLHNGNFDGEGDVFVQVAGLLRRAAGLLEQRGAGARQHLVRSSAHAADSANEPGRDGLPPIDERLTSKQLGAVFAIARRRGLPRDRIVALVRARTGKERVEHMTREEASALIGELDGRERG